jgi:hypothetical protein
MAAFAGPSLCAKGPELMSKKPRQAAAPVTAGNVPAPVRVRLRRINCDHARRPYPPDGQAREWWHVRSQARSGSRLRIKRLKECLRASQVSFGRIS